MIRTMYNLEKQDSKNIIKCSQIDNIQRENVLTMDEEKAVLKRAGQNVNLMYKQEATKIKANMEKLKNRKEVFDILDEKRALEKAIKKNTETYNNLSKENKEIYNKMKAEAETEAEQLKKASTESIKNSTAE